MKLSNMMQNLKIVIPQQDYILIDFELFFDECLGDYNIFCIDEDNDIIILKKILKNFMSQDNTAELYVCAYSYETTNYLGKKTMYADTLWINTKKDIKEIEKLFAPYRLLLPSDISLLKNEQGYKQKEIYLFKKNGDITKIKTTDGFQDNVKVIYWD